MEIFNEAKKQFDYMVRIRRQMHENPELTGKEYETLKFPMHAAMMPIQPCCLERQGF